MVHITDGTIIVENEKATLQDKIDLEDAVDTLIAEGSQLIYIDLSNPQYLPSELMGFLMWKKKLLMEENKNICITKLSYNLKTVFDNALLTDFFEINGKTEII